MANKIPSLPPKYIDLPHSVQTELQAFVHKAIVSYNRCPYHPILNLVASNARQNSVHDCEKYFHENNSQKCYNAILSVVKLFLQMIVSTIKSHYIL